MPQGGNGLQPRVAGSATLGDERNLSSTAMRLCLGCIFLGEDDATDAVVAAGYIFLGETTHRVAVEYLLTSFPG